MISLRSFYLLGLLILLIVTFNYYQNQFFKTSEPFIDLNGSSNPCCTAAQMALVYGSLKVNPTDPTQLRNAQTIYVNDIINLHLQNSNRKLALEPHQSKLSLSDKLNDNLQKLRIVPVFPQSSHQLYPLRYGDPIKLVFTLGRLNDYYITYDQYLGFNSADLNNKFQFVKANSPDSTDVIMIKDEVKIKVYTETNDPTYIGENSISKITADYNHANASTFIITITAECSPNWNFDFSDPNQKLVSPQQLQQSISSYSQTTNQQIENRRTEINKQRASMNQACNDRLKTIMSERALLQIQLNKLKTN